MKPKILFQPSPLLEKAIEELQAEVKAVGPDITRGKALKFFAELGWERWHQDKARKTPSK
jgi:hypothetical protein